MPEAARLEIGTRIDADPETERLEREIEAKRKTLLAGALAMQKAKIAQAESDLSALELFYMALHDNYFCLDGNKSKWWLYSKMADIAAENVKRRQLHLCDLGAGRPAPLYDLGTTPFGLGAMLGPMGMHCPVALTKSNLLLESTQKIDLAVSHNGYVYTFSSASAMQDFTDNPDAFAKAALPSDSSQCTRRMRGLEQLKAVAGLALPMALDGCCQVAMAIGGGGTQAAELVQGKNKYMVAYDDGAYRMATETSMLKFLCSPTTYVDSVAPTHAHALNHGKLPAVGLKSLPAVGYLEQSVADAVTAALTKVGVMKPKYPLLDSARSGLIALALELRAANPRLAEEPVGPVGDKVALYAERKAKFAEACKFVEHARAELEEGADWKIKVRCAQLEELRSGIDDVVEQFR